MIESLDKNESDDNQYISWVNHMGASLKIYLCGGVENINDRLIIYHSDPSTYFGVKHQAISFELEADAVKIIQDYDEFMNTDSVIS